MLMVNSKTLDQLASISKISVDILFMVIASWLLSEFSASFESFVKFCVANNPKYKEQMLVDGILVQLS